MNKSNIKCLNYDDSNGRSILRTPWLKTLGLWPPYKFLSLHRISVDDDKEEKFTKKESKELAK